MLSAMRNPAVKMTHLYLASGQEMLRSIYSPHQYDSPNRKNERTQTNNRLIWETCVSLYRLAIRYEKSSGQSESIVFS